MLLPTKETFQRFLSGSLAARDRLGTPKPVLEPQTEGSGSYPPWFMPPSLARLQPHLPLRAVLSITTPALGPPLSLPRNPFSSGI